MKNLTLEEAQTSMSEAIKKLDKIIAESDDNRAINAVNALSGVVRNYTKILEARELLKRIEALEETQKMRRVS